MAVYRPSEQVWYVSASADSSFRSASIGLAGDQAIAGDYDGDGRSDMSVFSNGEATWYVSGTMMQGIGTTRWGKPGDLPLAPPSMR